MPTLRDGEPSSLASQVKGQAFFVNSNGTFVVDATDLVQVVSERACLADAEFSHAKRQARLYPPAKRGFPEEEEEEEDAEEEAVPQRPPSREISGRHILRLTP